MGADYLKDYRTYPRMVRWFNPILLIKLLNNVVTSAMFGQYADRRLMIAALDTVPEPQLVLIQTIDNDMRCDGTDEAHIDAVGASVAEALNLIADASPMTQILVVSIIGRPATLAAAFGDEPSWVADHSGTGMCDLFDAAGQPNEENIARLTAIIEGYEAEVARVCAAVPQCIDDSGALAGLVPDINEYSGDAVHLSAAGHARVAETIWPIVAELLQISPP